MSVGSAEVVDGGNHKVEERSVLVDHLRRANSTSVMLKLRKGRVRVSRSW